jgi:hypothetical protein
MTAGPIRETLPLLRPETPQRENDLHLLQPSTGT